MKKLSKKLMESNMIFITMILMIAATAYGVIGAAINLQEAKIVKEFETKTLLTITILYVSYMLVDRIDKLFLKTFGSKIIDNVYTNTLHRLNNTGVSKIQKMSSGKIYGLTQELAGLKSGFYSNLTYIGPVLIPFSVLIYKEACYNWVMALISVLSVIICSFMASITDKLFGWAKDGKEAHSNLTGVTADNFGNVKTIKYLMQSRYSNDRLKEAQVKNWPYTVNVGKIIYFGIIMTLSSAPMIVNAWIARRDPAMIALIILSDYTLIQLRQYAADLVDIYIEIKAVKDHLKVLDGKDTEPLPLQNGNPIILDKVMFDYGGDMKFNIDHLEFDKNSRTLITGESGEGKSSLANLLVGAIDSKVGKVPRYRSYYIWQETEALDTTLWDNIVFNNEDDISEEEVLDIFDELNMLEFYASLSEGFNTYIGERGCKLSSGQKQRLNIVRLILNFRYHPEYVFIIDEITSNLDKNTRELAIDLINRECKSTLICISHNEGFDKICDKQILVENHTFKYI